jgi:integrase
MPHKHTRDGKWTGRWFGQVKHNGQKYRSSLVKTKGEAVEWEAAKRRELESPAPPSSATLTATALSLLEWGNRYMDFCVRYVPKTYSEKKNILARLMAHKGMDPLSPAASYTPGHALAFLQDQYEARGGNAANKERKNLVAAWTWGAKFLGLPQANPFMSVPPFPERRVNRYVPTESDFWRVVDLADGQARTMLLTFLHTAARRGELFRLRWEDVDFEDGSVRLFTRKRKDGSMEADWIPMTNELKQELQAHHCKYGGKPEDMVFAHRDGRHKGEGFREDRKFLRELCDLANVKRFDRHSIRHLTASILAKLGVPVVVIQGVLRHKRLTTTERYVKRLDHLRPHLQLLEGGAARKAQHAAQQKATTA